MQSRQMSGGGAIEHQQHGDQNQQLKNASQYDQLLNQSNLNRGEFQLPFQSTNPSFYTGNNENNPNAQ